jgi:hypothetical protein
VYVKYRTFFTSLTAYLRYVLARINDHKINALQALLPWNVAPLLANQAKKAA